MIYLDTSVLLAELLDEERRPPARLWSEPLVSSSLLEYEIWNRVHARGLGPSLGRSAKHFIARVSLIDLTRAVLARALEPFPVAVRTLDGLHLATVDFLRSRNPTLEIASYDERLLLAASALGVPRYPL